MKKLQLYNIFGRKVKATLGSSEGGSGVTVVADETELEDVIEEGKFYYVQSTHDFAYLDNTGNIAYLTELTCVKVAEECDVDSDSQYMVINNVNPYILYNDCFEVTDMGYGLEGLFIKLNGDVSSDLYYWRYTIPSDNFTINFKDTTDIIIPQSTQDVLSSLEEDHTYEFNLFAGVLNVIDVTPASTE